MKRIIFMLAVILLPVFQSMAEQQIVTIPVVNGEPRIPLIVQQKLSNGWTVVSITPITHIANGSSYTSSLVYVIQINRK